MYPTTLSDVTSAALAASVYLRGKDTLVASRPKGVCLQAALALIVLFRRITQRVAKPHEISCGFATLRGKLSIIYILVLTSYSSRQCQLPC